MTKIPYKIQQNNLVLLEMKHEAWYRISLELRIMSLFEIVC
jgi:hypothetical protein